MGGQSRTVAEICGEIAGRNHGVVTRTQLLCAGVTPRQIDHRLRAGALIRVHPGVYRAGHAAPSVAARYLAAVQACGEGAVLSGRAAGHLWGVLRGPPPPPEVTAPTERRVTGVTCHRCRTIDDRDRTIRRGIPVTSVPRTLVDLAASLTQPNLARALHEAGIRHGITPLQVEAALDRRPNTSGAAKLRTVLRGDGRTTLSSLETRFLALLRADGLPLPRTNARFGRRRLDCHWPEHRLVVELDSYRFHGSRHAWEEDRRRERLVRARGDEFRRYTWGDVFETPALMLRELRGLLRVGSAQWR
jgi:hypothetical protein